MIRLDNERARQYLKNKIIEYFDNNEYKEGSYNDNWFVENCNEDYSCCKYGDGFDWLYFSYLTDGLLNEDLGMKLTAYFHDKQEWEMPSEDEYCDREIEYVDWAISDKPNTCSWDLEKYRENKEHFASGFHMKWQNNELSDWWKDCKTRSQVSLQKTIKT